jgi:ATP-dependent RNA helicase DeaD
VRCNDADDTTAASSGDAKRGSRRTSDRDGGRTSRRKDAANDANPYEKRSKRRNEMEGRNRSQRGQRGQSRYESGRKDDWRQFINNPDIQLKGDEPDFSEEGWARRKPRKKK